MIKEKSSRTLVLPVVLVLAAAMIATSLGGGLTGKQISSVQPSYDSKDSINFGASRVISIDEGFVAPDVATGLAIWRLKSIDWATRTVEFTNGPNTKTASFSPYAEDFFGYEGEFVVGGHAIDFRVSPNNYVFLNSNVNRDYKVGVGETLVFSDVNVCLNYPCTGDVKYAPEVMLLNSVTSTQINLTRLYGGGTYNYAVNSGKADIVLNGISHNVDVSNGMIELYRSWWAEVV
ncbi:MAG: hypothetical protein Q8Q42_03320 [Nanoarchaeota archaeon]|nr:hypothetical protein [Nanoarchaeota archaeon]